MNKCECIVYMDKERKTFISQGTYGCVMYPRVKCNGIQSSKTNKKELSKIVEDTSISKNEISIGEKINKIMKGKKEKLLIGVSRSCNVSKRQISKYKKCNITRKNEKKQSFLLLYSQYIESISLRNYLYKDFSKVKFVKLYQSILESIRLMQRHNIVHNDLTSNNIIVSKGESKSIHVIDFGLSFCLDYCFDSNHKLNMDYLKIIFFPDFDFYLWPIEHHLMGYFVRYQEKPTQEELFSMIQKYYLNPKNTLFSNHPKINDYIEHVYLYFYKKYIHSTRPIEEDIEDILTYASSTWDLHSFSYVLLRCLKSLKNNNAFQITMDVLFGALHYNYEKRPSLFVHQENIYELKL